MIARCSKPQGVEEIQIFVSGTIPIGNNEADFVDWRKPGINTLV
jgi:hypothetical protein